MRRRSFLALPALILPAVAIATRSGAATPPLSLIMVDAPGCPYCAAWKREILPGYADHPTGRALPLRIVPQDGPWPDGIALDRAPTITPSFLLIRDGFEIARIEGYPGQGYFWAELSAVVSAHAPPSFMEGRP